MILGAAVPGILDAIALVNDAPLANLFSVQFTFIGTGTPGSQEFELTLWERFDPSNPPAEPAVPGQPRVR